MSERHKQEPECRRVLYSGNVQGVGFRYTVRSLAAGRCVVGYVRNLPDGRVELLVEGKHAEVTAFIGQVRAEMDAYIEDALETVVPASGLFPDFRIRF